MIEPEVSSNTLHCLHTPARTSPRTCCGAIGDLSRLCVQGCALARSPHFVACQDGPPTFPLYGVHCAELGPYLLQQRQTRNQLQLYSTDCLLRSCTFHITSLDLDGYKPWASQRTLCKSEAAMGCHLHLSCKVLRGWAVRDIWELATDNFKHCPSGSLTALPMGQCTV